MLRKFIVMSALLSVTAFNPLVSHVQATEDDAFDWVAMTLDNDLFVGNDNGYTNGFYVALLDTPENEAYQPQPAFWVTPLMWSMPDDYRASLNMYSFAQTMSSPSDITIAIPAENELPYSALLSFRNSFVTVNSDFADRATTTLGLVGPWALGEETQKFVHDLIGADEPKGWDTQLENELVFQFSRARAWRSWSSRDGGADLVTTAEISAGTLLSSVNTSAYIRFGEQLAGSYATMLFTSSRLSNPLAVKQGWFFYLGANAGYKFNQIFADGNTFRNSRSIDYDKEFIGLSTGIAKSWAELAFTFAFVDANLIQNSEDDDALENLTRYGTLTVAWKF